jgi:hypothetical protein
MRPSGRAYSNGVRDVPDFTHIIFLVVNLLQIQMWYIMRVVVFVTE